MKKILVPIDGSNASKKAAEKAIEVAKQYGSELTFLTVVDVPVFVNYAEIGISISETFLINRERMVKEKLKHDTEMLDMIVRQLDTSDVIKTEKTILVGEVFEQIIKLVEDEQYDLVVMSPKGIAGHKHSVLGSVTKKVIAEVSCPVLLVKE